MEITTGLDPTTGASIAPLARPQPQRLTAVLAFVAGLIVAVALLLSACGGGNSSGGSGGLQPDELAISCTGPLATPGATPQAAPSSCAPTLGGQVAHVDCATVTDLMTIKDARLLGDLNYKTGATSDAMVTTGVQGGRCTFQIPQNYLDALQTTAKVQDGVAIVDFIPRSGASSVGLLMRCPQVGGPDCLAVYMYSNQNYQCLEVVNGKKNELAGGTFAGQQFPAPQLEINKPNRLVISVQGNAVEGYINGRQICAGKTTLSASSSATVQITQMGGSAPVQLDIVDFYLYSSS
jgi:hypothetical protein